MNSDPDATPVFSAHELATQRCLTTPERIDITINGQPIQALDGDILLMAARRVGIEIPTMCDDPRIRASGSCGMCLVEIAGSSEPVRACSAPVTSGQVIATDTGALRAPCKARLDTILTNPLSSPATRWGRSLRPLGRAQGTAPSVIYLADWKRKFVMESRKAARRDRMELDSVSTL